MPVTILLAAKETLGPEIYEVVIGDVLTEMKHFQEDGPVSTAAGLELLRRRLGRSSRSYRDYAAASN
jgi:hypothetical protein